MCLTSAQCAKYKGYIFENGSMVCVTAAQCTKISNYLTYDSDDDSERLCIVKSRCPELGYELRIQCLT